jgi:hypothetical protein
MAASPAERTGSGSGSGAARFAAAGAGALSASLRLQPANETSKNDNRAADAKRWPHKDGQLLTLNLIPTRETAFPNYIQSRKKEILRSLRVRSKVSVSFS